MNISAITRIAALGLILAMGIDSAPAAAADSRPMGGADPISGAGLAYASKAFGPAIHGYPSLAGTEREVANPAIVYVDQAYGQAIYSYPRVARDTVAAFNLHYVDTGPGQAIHSYPGLDMNRGEVDILPVVPN